MGNLDLISFVKKEEGLVARCKETLETFKAIEDSKTLFVIELDAIGENATANAFLRDEMERFKNEGQSYFNNRIAALIIMSDSEDYTKTYARKFIFLSNLMGCEWIGHPVIEWTRGGINFKTWSKTMTGSYEEIASLQIDKLIKRLVDYAHLEKDQFNILVLHAGHKNISNTLMYWDLIRDKLTQRYNANLVIQELHVEEGQITDCYGCSFETCTYYALEKSCFYGGFVVESLYPRIESADAVVWICPNYNDAVSAKLMAVINRLTALYRSMSFQDKYILSVIVSGNSGNDTVAGQLVGALNINKGFRLPPFFAAMAIANDPGEIISVEDLTERVDVYVNRLCENLNKNATFF